MLYCSATWDLSHFEIPIWMDLLRHMFSFQCGNVVNDNVAGNHLYQYSKVLDSHSVGEARPRVMPACPHLAWAQPHPLNISAPVYVFAILLNIPCVKRNIFISVLYWIGQRSNGRKGRIKTVNLQLFWLFSLHELDN